MDVIPHSTVLYLSVLFLFLSVIHTTHSFLLVLVPPTSSSMFLKSLFVSQTWQSKKQCFDHSLPMQIYTLLGFVAREAASFAVSDDVSIDR